MQLKLTFETGRKEINFRKKMKVQYDNKKRTDKKLRVEIVRGLEDINNLVQEWDDLYSRSGNATPFYSRAWVHTFVSEKENKGTPILITVWSDSILVALLPLTIRSYCGVKIALGTPADMLCYTGILVDSEYPEALGTIARTCAQEKIAHVFYNKYTPSQDVITNSFFEELSKKGFVCKRWKRHDCLWTCLETSFDEVLAKRRTGEQRRWLLRKERRVFKQEGISVNCYKGREITPEIVKRIGVIQEDSWVKEEGKAVLGQPFYQKLLIEIAKTDLALVWLMTKDEDDIAFIYSLHVNDRLYPKWMSYRHKYGTSSSLSYGKVLYMQMIRYACDNGIRMLDLGFGLDDWKSVWAADKQEIDTLISGRGFIGRIAIWLSGILRMCARYKWFLSRYIRVWKKK